MQFHRQYSRISGKMDLVPFVNVVLLLLIFLFLSSSFTQPISPDNSSIQPESVHTLTITVGNAGDIWYNRNKIHPDKFAGTLETEIKQYGTTDLIIEVSDDARHGEIRELMAEAMRAGIRKIEFAQPVTKEAP
ncbi:MAG: biopolymer transporter ExbD [Candidatus Ratteibacteria bacterium]|jgi:biopolymer transport protein ExbD